MILTRGAVLTGVLVAMGCNAGPPVPEGSDRPSVAADPQAENGPDSERSAESAESVRSLTPERILSLLLQWDTAGLRFEDPHAEALDSVYCYLPEQDCFSPEPGWDMARIVGGYRFGPTYEGPDSAVFVIDFEGLGWISSEGLEAEEGIDSETVWFKRIAGSWRIVGVESQMPPHPSIDAALRGYARTAEDSAMLARWRN